MLFPHKSLDIFVKEMRSFGEFLIPYNFPKASPLNEDDISFIKTKGIVVDGYNLVVYYSKADKDNHYLEIVQITGKYIPFLPFSLVCKVGKRFLGDKCLSYIDFIKNNRKVYCWTVVLDKENHPTSSLYNNSIADCSYEGLEYRYLDRSKVNFY